MFIFDALWERIHPTSPTATKMVNLTYHSIEVQGKGKSANGGSEGQSVLKGGCTLRWSFPKDFRTTCWQKNQQQRSK
jgi:hypothetical protein